MHELNMPLILVYALNIVILFDLVEVKQTDSFTRDEDAPRDMLSMHMFKLHEKFNKDRQTHRTDNTVRSFQALPGKKTKKTTIIIIKYMCVCMYKLSDFKGILHIIIIIIIVVVVFAVVGTLAVSCF